MAGLVEIRDLQKHFPGRGLFAAEERKVKAVDGVSFSIAKNSIFGLVGESGCGKTTLSRALLYLDPPTAGSITFDSIPLGEFGARKLRNFRRRMQIVFQDPDSALDPKMRIDRSIAEGLINNGMAADKREKRIIELLKLVGISPDHRSRYPHEFSGGQKQRIVIARALSMEPEFLVLDEPVSNLDVSIQAQIINLLLDLKEELSLTYLFISHDLNLVAYLSDAIAVMYQGRIVEQAPAKELMNRPLHPYTLKLFSSVPGQKGERLLPDQEIKAGKSGGPVNISRTRKAGCPYFSQCPKGDSQCTGSAPALSDSGEGHLVACFKINTGVS
ncbi:MAG: ATP-binding cassette domain-containing protein [Spirochaeta sp.]|nr:ATP-binding cassette domain-containing protein [Spirochaeta sp.]